jgi:hypothetical protein
MYSIMIAIGPSGPHVYTVAVLALDQVVPFTLSLRWSSSRGCSCPMPLAAGWAWGGRAELT